MIEELLTVAEVATSEVDEASCHPRITEVALRDGDETVYRIHYGGRLGSWRHFAFHHDRSTQNDRSPRRLHDSRSIPLLRSVYTVEPFKAVAMP